MYLFRLGFVDYAVAGKGSAEQRIIEQMVRLWTQFAATGDPNGEHLRRAGVDRWPSIGSDHVDLSSGYRCLNIDRRLEVVELPETERMAFWDGLEREVAGGGGSGRVALARRFYEGLGE